MAILHLRIGSVNVRKMFSRSVEIDEMLLRSHMMIGSVHVGQCHVSE